MYARVNDTTDVVESQYGRRVAGGVGPLLPPPFEEGYTYYVIEEPIDRSGCPSDTAVLLWNGGDCTWAETATLAELRALKSAEINNARAEANRTYFNFQGKRVACDDLSWKDIISANAEIALTREMPEEWPGGWKTMDDSYVAIPDVATWTLFIKAMVNRGTAHFQHAQQLKAQLAAAETPEQIAAIKWETLDV